MIFINEFHQTENGILIRIQLEKSGVGIGQDPDDEHTSLELLDGLIEHRFPITFSCTVRVGKASQSYSISPFHLCTLLYNTCCAYYPLVYNVSVFLVWTLPLCILWCHLWCNLYLNVLINCFFFKIYAETSLAFCLWESRVIEFELQVKFSMYFLFIYLRGIRLNVQNKKIAPVFNFSF